MAEQATRQKRQPQPPRKCIFCGGTPISREHIWAAWMRSYLAPGRGVQYIHETQLDDDVIRVRPGPLDRQGDMRSQKLKVVCESCNNGWMSILQDRSKPVLLPLLLCNRKILSQHKQELLATWATMFAMVYETTIPTYAATTKEQRVTFKQDQKPPRHWLYWCAPFDGQSSPAIQTGFGSKKRNPLPDEDADEVHKASLTLCGAGGISFAVFSVSSAHGFQAFSQVITTIVERAGFVRLWPTAGLSLRITDHRTSRLSFKDLAAIRDALYATLRSTVAGQRYRLSPARSA